MDRDRLVNAHRANVARLCVRLFDTIQSHANYEEQLLALAATFLLLAEATGVSTQDAYAAVKNLMYDPIHSSGMDHRFAAMKYHLKTELLA